MKKFYCNKDKIKKNVKYKLIPFVLTGITLISGCSNAKNVKSSSLSTSSTNIENYIDIATQDLIPMKEIGTKKIDNSIVKFTENEYQSFNAFLKNIEVDYIYEDLYKLDESLAEYNKLQFTTNHKYTLTELTADNLYKTVLVNNQKYREKKFHSFYTDMPESNIRKICNLVVEVVQNYIKSNKNIDENKVMCVLSDLKVFEQHYSLASGIFTSENCLTISPIMLNALAQVNGSELDFEILVHEINHILQKGCNCDLEANPNLKSNFGFCYEFKNIDINSLNWTWIYEASAEKNMHNYTKNEILTYKNMINYMESLSIVNIFNDNYHVNDTENLSFLKTLDDVYNYFNAITEDDKIEVLNMMYSIEVMQRLPEDFYDSYIQKYKVKKSDQASDEILYNSKSSVCQTMAKLFYRNLIKCITNKEIPLNDIFYLISLFENDISRHIVYTDKQLYQYNKNFFDTYLDIQNNFFNLLSKNLNMRQDDIENKFNNYFASIKTESGTIQNNYSLNFLGEEKIQYLEYMRKDLYSNVSINIRTSNNNFKLLNSNSFKSTK